MKKVVPNKFLNWNPLSWSICSVCLPDYTLPQKSIPQLCSQICGPIEAHNSNKESKLHEQCKQKRTKRTTFFWGGILGLQIPGMGIPWHPTCSLWFDNFAMARVFFSWSARHRGCLFGVWLVIFVLCDCCWTAKSVFLVSLELEKQIMQENPISGCNPIYTGASTPRESRSNQKYQNFLMSKSQKTEVIYSKIIAKSSNRWFPKKEPGVFLFGLRC